MVGLYFESFENSCLRQQRKAVCTTQLIKDICQASERVWFDEIYSSRQGRTTIRPVLGDEFDGPDEHLNGGPRPFEMSFNKFPLLDRIHMQKERTPSFL